MCVCTHNTAVLPYIPVLNTVTPHGPWVLLCDTEFTRLFVTPKSIAAILLLRLGDLSRQVKS